MTWKWIAKAAVQKSVSLLPNAQSVNYLLQTGVSRGLSLTDDYLQKRLKWAGMHLDALRRHRPTTEPGWTAVELGSGWYPIVPISLFLAGADRVWMVDLEDLGRDRQAQEAITRVLDWARDGTASEWLGTVDPERIDRLARSADTLQQVGRLAALAEIGLMVRPGDAREFDPGPAPELICSNTVLEHIEPSVLAGILSRFADISGPGTVMSHLVDHCDHYAYVDPPIGVHHFLRYSDRAWRLIDNSLQPMNRLRASEYRALYGRLGIELTEEHLEGCSGADLVGVPLAERFRAMDPDDVACTSSWLVTRFS